MCAVRPLRASVHERLSSAAERLLLRLEKGGEDAVPVPVLRPLLTELLTAAAEEIAGVLEETVAEYELLVQRSEQEICRQRRLLDALLKPEVRLHRADVQPPEVNRADAPSEHQERGPREDQEDCEPAHVKEEQEELWIHQEADIIKFTFSPDTLKTEQDEGRPEPSHLHQSQTEEHGEGRAGPEAARDSGPGGRLEPEDSSETADSDDEWRESSKSSSERCTAGRKQASCPHCGKGFSRMYYLRAHMTTHTGQKPFGCSQCGKTFSLKEHLKSHVKIHTGEKPFSCCECGKEFRIKGDMLIHMSVHTGEKPFACSQCGRSFRLKWQLQTHAAVHTGEKPFSCSECGKRFGQREYLRSHMRIHTGEKPFGCPKCGKAYHHQAGLRAHARTHTGEKPFSCSHCGKRFNHKSCLRVHEKIHARDRPFSCSECGKAFDLESRLQAHRRVHGRKQPFACSHCGQRFSHKAKLEAHVRVHTGEKPFACSVCAQSFSRKDSLQIHVRLHTGEKPLSCGACNKRFSWTYQRKNHRCAGESSRSRTESRAGARPAENPGPGWD